MKIVYPVLLLLVISISLMGQDQYQINRSSKALDTNDKLVGDNLNVMEKVAYTIGFLKGGGGLIGGDVEFLVNENVGLQAGIGFVSIGAGINYHFQANNIRSSYLSLQYWNQGLNGENLVHDAIGPMYIYRGKKWFTAGLGIGVKLREGPAYELTGLDSTPILLLYNLGIYFAK